MNMLPLSTAKSSKNLPGTLTIKNKVLTLNHVGSIPVIIKKKNDIIETEVTKPTMRRNNPEAQTSELSNQVSVMEAKAPEAKTKEEMEKVKKQLSPSIAKESKQPVIQGATDNIAPNALSLKSALTVAAHSVEAPGFNTIYKDLHAKFPIIINLNNPVLLAVGIRKEMSRATGISSVILKKWIAWYCRKSNYYALHKEGAPRFNLDGSEAGIVTEKHQEKMDKQLERAKDRKFSPKSKNMKPDSSPVNTVINHTLGEDK